MRRGGGERLHSPQCLCRIGYLSESYYFTECLQSTVLLSSVYFIEKNLFKNIEQDERGKKRGVRFIFHDAGRLLFRHTCTHKKRKRRPSAAAAATSIQPPKKSFFLLLGPLSFSPRAQRGDKIARRKEEETFFWRGGEGRFFFFG